MPNKSFIIFSKIKNTFRVNLVWNLLQNFHEDRLIIQGRSMYLVFFNILAYLFYTNGCCTNAMLRLLRGMRHLKNHLKLCKKEVNKFEAKIFFCSDFDGHLFQRKPKFAENKKTSRYTYPVTN